MRKSFEARLEALEQRARPGEHICLHYVDDERYVVDGREVAPAEWADLAPTARYVIRVEYAELERV